MNLILQIKNIRTALILFCLAFFFDGELQAQNRHSVGVTTNCLDVTLNAKYIDSSCESVAWYVGTNTQPVSKNLVYKTSFSSSGTYKVCLQVYNFCTRWDTTICTTVTVKSCADPCDSVEKKLYIFKDSSKCGKFSFKAKPLYNSGYKPTYNWSFGDGTSSSNDDPSHQYSRDNSYKLCVEVKYSISGKKCSTTLCETIKVQCGNTSNCSWKEKNIYASNNCNKWVFEAPNYNDSCMQYKWTINGKYYYDQTARVEFNTKDSFVVCLTLKNACTGCDTSICRIISNDCLPNKKCNWDEYDLSIGHALNKEKCGAAIFEATYQKDTCIKTEFYFDGKLTAGRYQTRQFTKNGRYKYGFRYVNHCTGCDTIIYKWIEIGCFESKKCEWPEKIGFSINKNDCPDIKIWINEFMDSCYEYGVRVNGKAATIDKTYRRLFRYKIPENGKYTVCVTFYNNCTGCDTVICKSFTTDCIKAKKCDWSDLQLYYNPTRENCMKYIFEMTNYRDSCVKQKLKIVSGNTIIYQEYGRVHDFLFKEKGYYNVCMWAYNECLQCDTWVCETVHVNCEKSANATLKEGKIQISPNPNNGNFSFHNQEPISVSIFNLQGQSVADFNTIAPKELVSVSHLKDGIYLVVIRMNGITSKQKLIINRSTHK